MNDLPIIKMTKKEARRIKDNIGLGPKENGFGRWITDKEIYSAIQTLKKVNK